MDWSMVLTGGLLKAFETFNEVHLSEAARAAMPDCLVKMHPDSNGESELALILVPPGGSIASHTHRVQATMIVQYGEATAIGGDKDGQRVGPGTPIHFKENLSHGFRDAGPDGFAFYSINGGIQGRDFRLA